MNVELEMKRYIDEGTVSTLPYFLLSKERRGFSRDTQIREEDTYKVFLLNT